MPHTEVEVLTWLQNISETYDIEIVADVAELECYSVSLMRPGWNIVHDSAMGESLLEAITQLMARN